MLVCKDGRYCIQHSLQYCNLYTVHIQGCFPRLAPRCGTPSSPGSPSLSTRWPWTRSTFLTRCTPSAQGEKFLHYFTSHILMINVLLRYRELLNALKDGDEMQKLYKDNQQLFEYVSNHTGETLHDIWRHVMLKHL